MTTLDRLGAADLRRVVSGFRDALRAHQDGINRLNVYPVPDGDTGTNMALTMESVVAEIEGVADLDPADMAAICHAIGHGSLMGARGNSGVILSQILRRFTQVLAKANVVDGTVFAAGLTAAAEGAYEAVGKPQHEVNPEREAEAIKGFRDEQLDERKYGAYALDNPQWGMVIDLARCTGCSACVTACYAENNIPWVGEEDILRGREMSWMRIERYFEGGEDGEPIKARVIPMLCQQCDAAPCEPVCPVYAAYHTADGLNGQVYNRCVGTRYCANNCPYKVRYYNWYAYAKRAFVEPLNLQLNPDVTVRARGVMEKCTFCIQRIRGAQNVARLEDRQIADGEIIPACAQACGSGAITFGNLNDPGSKVVQAARNPRGYRVLEELNTRPAVTYLARVEYGSEA